MGPEGRGEIDSGARGNGIEESRHLGELRGESFSHSGALRELARKKAGECGLADARHASAPWRTDVGSATRISPGAAAEIGAKS